ncbi:rhodanese-like domain-containing protein [Patulibacter sp. NPDC049589]|uniref:rhodanese-like domain-containing protein n=1 Tax=Patulibacter sp. NPDC049589 TaxID=3154731 RepID=UPI00344AC544
MTDTTTACDLPSTPETPTAAVLVSPVVAAAAVRGGARFIDVRSAGGRERTGGLPEAEIVDRERLEETFDDHEPGRPIVVICGSINGSGPVAEELIRRGFTDVVHVDGGFPAWKDAGLPTTEATAPAA